MGRTRHILAVTMVATALCADRLSAAAPVLAVRLTGVTRLATRLGSTFRQRLATVRFQRIVDVRRAARLTPRPVVALVSMASRVFTPFQFRLPPPLL